MMGYSLGAVGLLLFAPLARRIRNLMPDGFTSGDFIRLRYGNTAWRIFLLISLFYSIGWLISLGMAGGLLINALSGIPYFYGMSVIVFICTLYTVFGGLKAVIVTDFVQTILILVGIAALAILTIDAVGINTIHQRLVEERPLLLNFLLPASIMFLFNNLFFGIGEVFHSNVWWSRAFAFAPGVGFKAYALAGVLWLPIPIVAGFVAFAAPALGINVASPDMVAPLVAGKLLGMSGAILVFVVVFSALASSLDSVLAATSDLIVEDIYKGHFRKNASQAELKKATVWMILLLSGLTWVLAIPKAATLGALLHLTGAFVASTIWPITIGLLYNRGNGTLACLAMVLGTGAGLVGYFEIGFYVAALVSTAVSMAVMSLAFFQSDHFNWDSLRETPAKEES